MAIESGELSAERTLAEGRQQEAEKHAAEELDRRDASERAEREAAARSQRACVVPRLDGDSLPTAARALDKAHCSLGKLTRPHDGRGALVVVRQGVPVGKKLARDSRVAVTLGQRRR